MSFLDEKSSAVKSHIKHFLIKKSVQVTGYRISTRIISHLRSYVQMLIGSLSTVLNENTAIWRKSNIYNGFDAE